MRIPRMLPGRYLRFRADRRIEVPTLGEGIYPSRLMLYIGPGEFASRPNSVSSPYPVSYHAISVISDIPTTTKDDPFVDAKFLS